MIEMVFLAAMSLNVDVSIGAASAYDEICRGSTEPTSKTAVYACKRRDELFDILLKVGWCYDSPSVTAKWHKCTEAEKPE